MCERRIKQPQHKRTAIHTYIVDHYNPSERIIDLVSHTTYVCVLIFYISGAVYCLKSTPNNRFFVKLFMAILFTLIVFAKNLLRRNRRRNIFRILFLCSAWGSNPGFTSNEPTTLLCIQFAHNNNIILEKA